MPGWRCLPGGQTVAWRAKRVPAEGGKHENGEQPSRTLHVIFAVSIHMLVAEANQWLRFVTLTRAERVCVGAINRRYALV